MLLMRLVQIIFDWSLVNKDPSTLIFPLIWRAVECSIISYTGSIFKWDLLIIIWIYETKKKKKMFWAWWFSFHVRKMWLPVVGSFYLCFKIRGNQAKRVAATAGTMCLCPNMIYSQNKSRAQHSCRAIMGRKKKKKKNPQALQNWWIMILLRK